MMSNKLATTAVILLAGALSGCAMSPGMQMDEKSHLRGVFSTKEKEPEVNVEPITPALIAQMNRDQLQKLSSRMRVNNLSVQMDDYTYRVGPRDILGVMVWEHPELTTTSGLKSAKGKASGLIVRSDGTIFFPYVGVLGVAGKTIEEVRSTLTRELGRYINDPQVNVQVAEFRSQKVYITGEVIRPGVYPVTDVPLTVLDATTLAGGVKGVSADVRHILWTRDGDVQQIDLQALLGEGDLSQNVLLQDGDTVHFQDNQINKVWVLGEVSSVKTQLIHHAGMTLAEALGDAGGLNNATSDPERIYIIRGARPMQGETTVASKPAVYRFNGKSAASMVLADQFQMRPHDVVFVAPAGVVSWNRVMSQILPSIELVWKVDDFLDRN